MNSMHVKIYDRNIQTCRKMQCGCEIIKIDSPYFILKLCNNDEKEFKDDYIVKECESGPFKKLAFLKKPSKCINCTHEFFLGVKIEGGKDLCQKCFEEFEKHWPVDPNPVTE